MTIEPKRPKEARHLFLARFYDLWYGERTIRFENGAFFFSGKAGDAFTALTQSFELQGCCEAMESGIARTRYATRLFLRKAA
jgi:hypothetical protein